MKPLLPLMNDEFALDQSKTRHFLSLKWSRCDLKFEQDCSSEGVANGKIRDSPRRRDPCFKIRDRDLNDLRKSEPETL